MANKILIMDDSKVSRLFVVNYWREINPDWEFVEAETGEEAIRIAGQQPFHAIILDYNMPDINGLAVAEQVKQLQPQCFIALLTANIQRYVSEETEKRTLHLYHKPVTAEVIKQIAHDTEVFYGAIQ